MGRATLEQLPVEYTMKDRTYASERGLGHLKMHVEPYPIMAQTRNEGQGESRRLGLRELS